MFAIKDIIYEQKEEVENSLVLLGENIVPSLIQSIQNTNGKTRGLFAMVIIRIGKICIPYLEESKSNKDFKWIADYLISEII